MNINKKIIAIIIIAAVIAAIALVWAYEFFSRPEAPQSLIQVQEESPVSKNKDTTSEINAGIESVDLGDLDKEFQDIDAELNNL